MPNANTAASLLKSMFKNERIDVLVPGDIVTVSFLPSKIVFYYLYMSLYNMRPDFRQLFQIT